jgi:N6-adenosine-specific RNA methylase IME4
MTRYRTIVADPPWDYRERGMTSTKIIRRDLPYASMSVEEIAALPVRDLAASDARLFLWTTNRHLPEAFMVAAAWGFKYRQLIVWDKRPNVNPLGGSIAPNSAEYLLVAQRGTPGRAERWTSSIVQARKARSHHSAKPDAFIDLVEQVSPGPYVEMFARRARFGWDYWGDESLGTAEMAA